MLRRMMYRAMLLCILLLGVQGFGGDTHGEQIHATQTQGIVKFDVVSIRRRMDYDRPSPLRLQWTDSGYIAEGISPRWLLGIAYNVQFAWVTNIPKELEAARFDVIAKVAPLDLERFHALPLGQKIVMLQSLLKERFQIRTHIEPRISPVYDLVIRKSGAKLIPSAARLSHPGESPQKKVMVGGTMIAGENATLADLASALGNKCGRRVIDQTHMSGIYDFRLRWDPEDNPLDESVNSHVFDALKNQLGLELISSKAPIDYLFVDHMEMPSEN